MKHKLRHYTVPQSILIIRSGSFLLFCRGFLCLRFLSEKKNVIHEHAESHSKKDAAEQAASSTTRTAVASWNLGWFSIPPKSMDTTLKWDYTSTLAPNPCKIADWLFWYHQLRVSGMKAVWDSKYPAGLSRTRQVEPWQLPNLANPLKNPGKKLRNQQTGVSTLISTFNETLRASLWPVLWQVAWCQWHILDFSLAKTPKLLTQQMAAEPSSNQAGWYIET